MAAALELLLPQSSGINSGIAVDGCPSQSDGIASNTTLTQVVGATISVLPYDETAAHWHVGRYSTHNDHAGHQKNRRVPAFPCKICYDHVYHCTFWEIMISEDEG
jgi:hypothetical protein